MDWEIVIGLWYAGGYDQLSLVASKLNIGDAKTMGIVLRYDENEVWKYDQHFINEFRDNIRIRLHLSSLLLKSYDDLPSGDKAAIRIQIFASYMELTEDVMLLLQMMIKKHERPDVSLWKHYLDATNLKPGIMQSLGQLLKREDDEFYIRINLPFDGTAIKATENKNYKKIVSYYKNDIEKFHWFMKTELQTARVVILNAYNFRRTEISKNAAGQNVLVEGEKAGYFVENFLNNAKHGMQLFIDAKNEAISNVEYIEQKGKKTRLLVQSIVLDKKALVSVRHEIRTLTCAMKNILDWYLFWKLPISSTRQWIRFHPHANFRQEPPEWLFVIDEDNYLDYLNVDDKYLGYK